MDLRTLLQQRRTPIFIIGTVLVLALVLEAGFYLGQQLAYRGMGAKPKFYKEMQAELIALQDTLRARDTELAIRSTRHEVDRQALEMVRKELSSQNEEIAGLVEGLSFYRSLMSTGDVPQGLSLRGLELIAGDNPRQYSFRIVVQQEARKHEQLRGSLTVVVNGVLDGQPAKYSLAELSDDVTDKGADLEFRYFQSVRGTMLLPEGFEPASVTVTAKTTKPTVHEIREEYPWRIEEKFTHVRE
ncbi:MAG: hypothetical protein H6985_05445 [Pseudomonadales bacterium]|nr:hypothetical protein [Pseudomonadales bacterium]